VFVRNGPADRADNRILLLSEISRSPLAQSRNSLREAESIFCAQSRRDGDNRAVPLRLVVADRPELDAQVSAEDTLGPLSTHRRQRSAHQRPAEGGAQDVYLPGGHFHRRHGISESVGECRRLALTVDLCVA